MTPQQHYHLEDVTKHYGGRPVLHVDRLETVPGEILALVGPTGAGKSTLLRLLAGVEAPSRGVVALGDTRWQTLAPLAVRRRVTLVFQRPLLLARTVRANLTYGLQLRGLRRQTGRVEAILKRLGLGNFGTRAARTLSGGETQLVALARALVLEPEVLLLDEPTANLDPARVGLVEEVIAEVHRQQGTTIVWATHNLFQARRVADRVAFLLDSHLIEVSRTATFFEAPRDPRSAAFVRGEMVY